MKIKIGNSAFDCEITNDDGTPLPFPISRIEIVVDSDLNSPEFVPTLKLEGYVPAGSTIEIDGRIIEVASHKDSELFAKPERDE